MKMLLFASLVGALIAIVAGPVTTGALTKPSDPQERSTCCVAAIL
jgi:hypothetical protein